MQQLNKLLLHNYVYMTLPTTGTSFASGKRSHLDIPAMIVKQQH